MKFWYANKYYYKIFMSTRSLYKGVFDCVEWRKL